MRIGRVARAALGVFTWVLAWSAPAWRIVAAHNTNLARLGHGTHQEGDIMMMRSVRGVADGRWSSFITLAASPVAAGDARLR